MNKPKEKVVEIDKNTVKFIPCLGVNSAIYKKANLYRELYFEKVDYGDLIPMWHLYTLDTKTKGGFTKKIIFEFSVKNYPTIESCCKHFGYEALSNSESVTQKYVFNQLWDVQNAIEVGGVNQVGLNKLSSFLTKFLKTYNNIDVDKK